ncbi:MAG: PEGA domain-containing protein [Nannocystis sp.]|nr:PEGA domain-containing protein [Nannocystis sp.]MBA3544871.1 PEGA domain-containing protein [Nannocystis sp.]
MLPCLSWLTLTMLTTAPATAPAAASATATPAASATATPAASAATPSPSASGDAEARAEQAASLYAQRKYAEAAVVLEDLWASIHEPRDLFNAALARLAVGHRAHAIRYWEIYLQQPNIPADGREQALGRIKKAQAASVAVNLRLAPAAVAEVGVHYTLTRIPTDPKDARPPLKIELPAGAQEFSAGGRTVYLDAGRWQLTVEARGYRSALQELSIRSGQAGFVKEIVLASDPMFRQATFQIDPPEAVTAGATVTLRRMTLAAQPVPCPLTPAGSCSLKLEPGDWEVVVSAPGYQRYSEKVSLGAQPTANFAVALMPTVAATVAPPMATPDPTAAGEPVKLVEAPQPVVIDVVPRKTRVKLSTGLVASGIPIFIGGLALAVTGSNSYQDRVTAGDSTGELRPAIRMRSAGMGLVGAAVGLWTTGLTAEYDVKPAVWYAELGVGGAFLMGGAIWAGLSTRRWNRNQVPDMRCTNSEGVDCFASHRMGAAFFLGAGSAMLVGSTIGLLVQRHYMRHPAASKARSTRPALSPYFAGTGGGLLVQGRF